MNFSTNHIGPRSGYKLIWTSVIGRRHHNLLAWCSMIGQLTRVCVVNVTEIHVSVQLRREEQAVDRCCCSSLYYISFCRVWGAVKMVNKFWLLAIVGVLLFAGKQQDCILGANLRRNVSAKWQFFSCTVPYPRFCVVLWFARSRFHQLPWTSESELKLEQMKCIVDSNPNTYRFS